MYLQSKRKSGADVVAPPAEAARDADPGSPKRTLQGLDYDAARAALSPAAVQRHGGATPAEPGSEPGTEPRGCKFTFFSDASYWPGHAFFSITDADGAEYCYGLYPECGFAPGVNYDQRTGGAGMGGLELLGRTMLGTPGVVINDKGHGATASLVCDITPTQFHSAQLLARDFMNNPPHYNLATFNCADFTLHIAEFAGVDGPARDWFGVFDNPADLAEKLEAKEESRAAE